MFVPRKAPHNRAMRQFCDKALYDILAFGLLKVEQLLPTLGIAHWKLTICARCPDNKDGYLVVGSRGDEDFQERISLSIVEDSNNTYPAPISYEGAPPSS